MDTALRTDRNRRIKRKKKYHIFNNPGIYHWREKERFAYDFRPYKAQCYFVVVKVLWSPKCWRVNLNVPRINNVDFKPLMTPKINCGHIETTFKCMGIPISELICTFPYHIWTICHVQYEPWVHLSPCNVTNVSRTYSNWPWSSRLEVHVKTDF